MLSCTLTRIHYMLFLRWFLLSDFHSLLRTLLLLLRRATLLLLGRFWILFRVIHTYYLSFVDFTSFCAFFTAQRNPHIIKYGMTLIRRIYCLKYIRYYGFYSNISYTVLARSLQIRSRVYNARSLIHFLTQVEAIDEAPCLRFGYGR